MATTTLSLNGTALPSPSLSSAFFGATSPSMEPVSAPGGSKKRRSTCADDLMPRITLSDDSPSYYSLLDGAVDRLVIPTTARRRRRRRRRRRSKLDAEAEAEKKTTAKKKKGRPSGRAQEGEAEAQPAPASAPRVFFSVGAAPPPAAAQKPPTSEWCNGANGMHESAKGLWGMPFPHLDVLAEIYGKDRAIGEGVETFVDAVHNIETEEANPMLAYIGGGPNVGDDDNDNETQSVKRTASSSSRKAKNINPLKRKKQRILYKSTWSYFLELLDHSYLEWKHTLQLWLIL
uniref:Uncharacterized protein n=1 Tax=Ananas comosus var. bracteatus TaxID=296719 RepID=A0A6V7QMZ0_ANACO|nr:unnamed protein product [Ananas comosus var. bracteatus]